jgi:hypothetical protein
LILTFTGDVRCEFAGKASSSSIAREVLELVGKWSSWDIARELLEAAVADGRQTRLKYGSGLDVLQALPKLIELSKRRSPRVDGTQEQQSGSTPRHASRRRTNIAPAADHTAAAFGGQDRLNFPHTELWELCSERRRAQIAAINDKETPCRMAAYSTLQLRLKACVITSARLRR